MPDFDRVAWLIPHTVVAGKAKHLIETSPKAGNLSLWDRPREGGKCVRTKRSSTTL